MQLDYGPCFIANPPYGERLGDRRQAESLYRAFKPLLQRHPGSRLNVITSHPGFERVAGLRAVRRTRLYNGRLECEFCGFKKRENVSLRVEQAKKLNLQGGGQTASLAYFCVLFLYPLVPFCPLTAAAKEQYDNGRKFARQNCFCMT